MRTNSARGSDAGSAASGKAWWGEGGRKDVARDRNLRRHGRRRRRGRAMTEHSHHEATAGSRGGRRWEQVLVAAILFGRRDRRRVRRRSGAHRRCPGRGCSGRVRQGMQMNPRVPRRSGPDMRMQQRLEALQQPKDGDERIDQSARHCTAGCPKGDELFKHGRQDAQPRLDLGQTQASFRADGNRADLGGFPSLDIQASSVERRRALCGPGSTGTPARALTCVNRYANIGAQTPEREVFSQWLSPRRV